VAKAVDFDGSGQVWFKILGLGPTCSDGSVTWPLSDLLNFLPSIIPANQLSDTYSCNVTKNLPSGHYLLRFEQFGNKNPYPAEIQQFRLHELK
jgi:hypothetical protein